MSGSGLGIQHLQQFEELGAGGFSVVYAATNTMFDRRVAVKVLAPLGSEADRRRFERECRVMGRLSTHANVVNVYNAGITADGRPYIEMELVDGGTLADRLETRGRIPWREAIAYLAPIGDALHHAHMAEILHRDIKPENILLAGDDPRLTDFGIAHLRDATASTSTQVSASWLHSPPETFRNLRDTRSDLYSLGSTLYTLLVGAPPFWRGNDETISPLMFRLVNEPAPRLPPDLGPPALADLIDQLLAKDPDDRPQSAAEVVNRLDAIAAGIEPSPPPADDHTTEIDLREDDVEGTPAPASPRPERPGPDLALTLPEPPPASLSATRPQFPPMPPPGPVITTGAATVSGSGPTGSGPASSGPAPPAPAAGPIQAQAPGTVPIQAPPPAPTPPPASAPAPPPVATPAPSSAPAPAQAPATPAPTTASFASPGVARARNRGGPSATLGPLGAVPTSPPVARPAAASPSPGATPAPTTGPAPTPAAAIDPAAGGDGRSASTSATNNGNGSGGRPPGWLLPAGLGAVAVVLVMGALALAGRGPSVPGAVAAVSADAGDGVVTLDFEESVDPAATSYEVSIDGGPWEVLAADRTVVGLDNGRARAFRVRGVNDDGPGGASPSSDPVTPYGPPSAPQITGTADDGTITWRWTEPEGNGQPIAGYLVSVDDGPETLIEQPTFTPADTFGPLERHRISVRAVNAGTDPERNTGAPAVSEVRTDGSVTVVLTQSVAAGGADGIELRRDRRPIEHGLAEEEPSWRISCQSLGGEYLSVYWEIDTAIDGDEVVIELVERLRYERQDGRRFFSRSCDGDDAVPMVDERAETFRFPLADGSYELPSSALGGQGATSTADGRTVTVILLTA
ncbi:MAG: protein kinase [Actinomycetota bacterium]